MGLAGLPSRRVRLSGLKGGNGAENDLLIILWRFWSGLESQAVSQNGGENRRQSTRLEPLGREPEASPPHPACVPHLSIGSVQRRDRDPTSLIQQSHTTPTRVLSRVSRQGASICSHTIRKQSNARFDPSGAAHVPVTHGMSHAHILIIIGEKGAKAGRRFSSLPRL